MFEAGVRGHRSGTEEGGNSFEAVVKGGKGRGQVWGRERRGLTALHLPRT